MGRFRDFMSGRYGQDQLNRFLLVLSLVLLVVYWIAKWRFLWIVVLALIVLTYIRMLSRNYEQRRQENERYLKATEGIRRWLRLQKNRWRDRKTHRYFRCPQCHSPLRVPKGKGRIAIRCQHCGNTFEKTT